MSNLNHKTGSARAKLRFWGWGYADEQLGDDELQMIDLMLEELMPGGSVEVDEPQLDDFKLPPPRVEVPQHSWVFTSISKYDRLVHSFGKSYADLVGMLLRRVDNPPDWVCFPRDESDVERILAHATENNIAVIPFGGGTSVCGAVEPAVGNSYRATISLDLEHFNRVLEIDQTSRAARVQAGILGPVLEAALRPHGLTLRHFPQSFKFSTLGGWIATRAGGHFATLYTHVDDFFESTRMITPRGIIQTRRLPGSGAGPSQDRMVLGSEGILGVITEAWVKLQQVPRWRASTSLRYANFSYAADAVRRISQAGLYPSNCRLLDQTEAHWSGLDGRRGALLMIGFESADHPQTASMDRALAVLQSNAAESADIVYSDIQQDAPSVALLSKSTGCLRPYCRYL
ncbi:MAG: FAD-binding oxidoreductase [Cellvibrionales bacterium]